MKGEIEKENEAKPDTVSVWRSQPAKSNDAGKSKLLPVLI